MANNALQTGDQSELILLQEKDIQVSKLRFIVGNQTYAMSGITSVKSEEVPAGLTLPVLLILLGATFLFAQAYVVGVLLIAWGILVVRSRSGQRSVTLGTSGGEIQSYISKDKDFISKVVKALNDAIILRG